jgi:uncharacterized protein (DUF2336 family)
MQHASLIDELESAVKGGSAENRINTLRRVTDLFLHDADRLNDEQIKVFDDVLCHLAAKIEKTALAELGTRLAPVDTAPVGVIKRLAHDDDIDVAAPVLTGSKRLTTADLVELAQTKSQGHLLAISKRDTLETKVTDVLLDRGDRSVVSTLATNGGARFSDAGFTILVEKTGGDDQLGEIVGQRRDLPDGLLRELLRRATDAVKARILALLPPERRKEVEAVLNSITKKFSKNTEHDYSEAERRIDALVQANELNESILAMCVRQKRRDELIVGLARLSSAPVKTTAELLNGQRNDAVLMPCKAANLGWPTVRLILEAKLEGHKAADKIIELAQSDYARLTVATAQRTLRFISIHKAAE